MCSQLSASSNAAHGAARRPATRWVSAKTSGTEASPRTSVAIRPAR